MLFNYYVFMEFKPLISPMLEFLRVTYENFGFWKIFLLKWKFEKKCLVMIVLFKSK